MTDAYHRVTLQLSQVGAFAYVVPLALDNDGITICINLVLAMGWVESPKFLRAFPDTLTEVSNALVDMDLLVPSYGAISDLPSTETGPTHTRRILSHIRFYMDDIISAVTGGPE